MDPPPVWIGLKDPPNHRNFESSDMKKIIKMHSWNKYFCVGKHLYHLIFRATRHEILPSALSYQALMLLQKTQTFATNKLKQRNVKINFFWVFVCSKLFVHNIISPGLTLTIKSRQNYLQSPGCIYQKKLKIGPRYI